MTESRVIELKEEIEILSQKESVFCEYKKNFEEQFKDLISDISEKKKIIAEIKTEIEQEAIKEFKMSGEKKLLGGIGIRVSKCPEYDEKEAFSFAKKKEMFLQLDKKAFDKAALSLVVDFVTEKENVTVTFPKELKL